MFQNILLCNAVPVNLGHTFRIQGNAGVSRSHQYFLSQQFFYLIDSFPQIFPSYIFIVRSPEHINNFFSCGSLFHAQIIEKSFCFLVRKIHSFPICFYIWSAQKMYFDSIQILSLTFYIPLSILISMSNVNIRKAQKIRLKLS